MAEQTKETENINAVVPRALKKAIVDACALKPDGVSRYSMSEVVRIMLARGFDANHHLRLEEAEVDAGEEAGA